jgi:hypothetical protein
LEGNSCFNAIVAQGYKYPEKEKDMKFHFFVGVIHN